MSAKWQKDFSSQPILDRIRDIAKVDKGKVSFEGFECHAWRAVLEENLDLHDEIPSSNCGKIVWKALVECAKASDFSSQSFLRFVIRAEGEYLALPTRDFYLLSSISLPYDRAFRVPSFNNCRITFTRSFPPHFDRKSIESGLRFEFENRPLPKNYTHVRVAVRGRTPEEAGIRSLNAIDLARSLLNFQVNLTKGTRYFSGRPRSINLIAAGPLSTLHERDGKLAKEMWWFEPDYVEPAKIFNLDDLARLRKNEDWILKQLRSHPYRKEMEKLFRRYGRALDESNYDYAIVKLWSVLERLMATDKYELLTRRAANIYEDQEHHRAILNHIRQYRNRMIHGGHSSETRNETVHQLRQYVQHSLLFHLRRYQGAKSIAERVQLLDLPSKLEDLRRRKRLIESAIRYRTPKKRPRRKPNR